MCIVYARKDNMVQRTHREVMTVTNRRAINTNSTKMLWITKMSKAKSTNDGNVFAITLVLVEPYTFR